ncbi:MAG: DinB family protein [Gemmatimonadaceae bacterium]
MIDDFRSEFERYRLLAEKALAQMPDSALNTVTAPDGNSAAMIVRHMSGNLVSRFTNFLTEDGEKPTRDRDSEFADAQYARAEMDVMWKAAWHVLDDTLAQLTDEDASRTVTIREQPMTVHAALFRAVAHQAYHVGQLVLLARITAEGEWRSLSIPKGASQLYNAAPDREKKPT